MERIIKISTVYSRARVCRAKVWDSYQSKTATAKARGCGYCKESSAVAAALNSLGVKLGAVASYGGGVGMGSIINALRADGFSVYEVHPTDDVAVYVCIKD